ncbi:type II secretion system major pseudopilin GspG [Desulfamplus magnetovallimortis]|uniref:type II secretion system major pseudopilin GspG n=1 Tax=Desulfamplus magnetovallimortis TaxID=1246637 RepID=UPI003CCBB9F7
MSGTKKMLFKPSQLKNHRQKSSLQSLCGLKSAIAIRKNCRKISLPPKNMGFTLIELMVVVVILGVLASLIVPRLMGRTDDAKIVKAKVDISAIETALKLYRLDNGRYPTTEQGLSALVEEPSTEPLPVKWPQNGYLDRGQVPKDPWGMEYLYLSPGVHREYDIISYGADGAPGGEGIDADIKSWELE